MCVLCDEDVQQYIEHDGPIHPNNYPSVYQNGYLGVLRRMQLMNMMV
jgi:hypothetical protein